VGKWDDAEDLTSDFDATSRQTTIPIYGDAAAREIESSIEWAGYLSIFLYSSEVL